MDQVVTVGTLAESISTVPLPMMYPRKETDGTWNSHFSALTREFPNRRCRTAWTWCSCSSLDQEKIRILFRQT